MWALSHASVTSDNCAHGILVSRSASDGRDLRIYDLTCSKSCRRHSSDAHTARTCIYLIRHAITFPFRSFRALFTQARKNSLATSIPNKFTLLLPALLFSRYAPNRSPSANQRTSHRRLTEHRNLIRIRTCD